MWEWTRSQKKNYPYKIDEREDSTAGPDERRVLRGGSFLSSLVDLACAVRGSYNPDHGGGVGGFRVVLSPVSDPPASGFSGLRGKKESSK